MKPQVVSLKKNQWEWQTSSKTDKERKKTWIANITNETGDVNADTADIRGIIRECLKQLYT